MKTEPTRIEIPYVGGPFDGATCWVDLDANGQPPEFPTTQDIGPIDYEADPAEGPLAGIVTHMYELDSKYTETGSRWFYRFVGQTTLDMRHAA